jgi:hypothetical protein
MKKNLYERSLLKAIRKTGCEPIDVQEIEENLIQMSLLPPNAEIPVKTVFRIIPWQKYQGEVVAVSDRHKDIVRRLHEERKAYCLAFIYTSKVILLRPLKLPVNLSSYSSVDDENYTTIIVDLEKYGTSVSLKK